ncbi:MAG: DEAD/DEAH box helicase, partial [Candidatus Hodarchaeales archaeon]
MTITLPLKLPQQFSAWFPFSLNVPQLEVSKKIFDCNDNILVIAPTGTGKTAIGELAIVKELIRRGESEVQGPVAIFLVPLKAITSERMRIWEKRQGIKTVVVTAETAVTFDDIMDSDIIISVPEKIDSITRNPELEIEPFLNSIRVLVLDEVHLLDMDGRGDALEALVTRFFRKSKERERTRIVALSATVPNYEDVAAWLRVPSSCIFRYGEEYRPITLETRFLAYQEGESFEEDRQIQNKLVLEQIEKALEKKYQVIVFVNSRKGTEKLTKRIVNFWDKNGTHADLVSAETMEISDKVESKPLSNITFAGVGFHHAGLSQKDRELIEIKFIEGFCRILVSTTTLAWGVNLPADLVIVRDVEIYDSLKGRILIEAIDIQQMLGRAGRPGYSRGIGFGAVIVPQEKLSAIKKRIAGDTEIKSRFSESLKEHLLAEIVRGTIINREDAFDWLEHTYFCLRLKRTESDPTALIREKIDDSLKYLQSSGFISCLEGELQSSALGKLSTRFYLRLETASKFSSYLNTEEKFSFIMLIILLASAEEFERVAIRKEEISFIEEIDLLISQETVKKVPTLNMGQKKIA